MRVVLLLTYQLYRAERIAVVLNRGPISPLPRCRITTGTIIHRRYHHLSRPCNQRLPDDTIIYKTARGRHVCAITYTFQHSFTKSRHGGIRRCHDLQMNGFIIRSVAVGRVGRSVTIYCVVCLRQQAPTAGAKGSQWLDIINGLRYGWNLMACKGIRAVDRVHTRTPTPAVAASTIIPMPTTAPALWSGYGIRCRSTWYRCSLARAAATLTRITHASTPP